MASKEFGRVRKICETVVLFNPIIQRKHMLNKTQTQAVTLSRWNSLNMLTKLSQNLAHESSEIKEHIKPTFDSSRLRLEFCQHFGDKSVLIRT